jgi:hypothetical protein
MDYLACKRKWAQLQIDERNFGMLVAHTKFHEHVQSDSGGICSTLGNNSMCDSKQKSSHEHGSDFERLWSYDRLKIRR